MFVVSSVTVFVAGTLHSLNWLFLLSFLWYDIYFETRFQVHVHKGESALIVVSLYTAISISVVV